MQLSFARRACRARLSLCKHERRSCAPAPAGPARQTSVVCCLRVTKCWMSANICATARSLSGFSLSSLFLGSWPGRKPHRGTRHPATRSPHTRRTVQPQGFGHDGICRVTSVISLRVRPPLPQPQKPSGFPIYLYRGCIILYRGFILSTTGQRNFSTLKSSTQFRYNLDPPASSSEEEEDLFVFNDTIEGPRAPAVKPGRVTQA